MFHRERGREKEREGERKREREREEKERKRRRVGQERRETEAQCPLTFISISLRSNYIPTTARLSHCTVPPCPCFVGGVFSSFLIWGKVGAVLWLSVCGCLSGWFLVFLPRARLPPPRLFTFNRALTRFLRSFRVVCCILLLLLLLCSRRFFFCMPLLVLSSVLLID